MAIEILRVYGYHDNHDDGTGHKLVQLCVRRIEGNKPKVHTIRFHPNEAKKYARPS